MADFQTKNPNLGQFWWDLQVAMEAIGVFCGNLVYFMVIWYTFSRFGMLSQEKSGNPDCDGWQFFTKRLHINGMVDNKYVLAERDWSD
jgi:hypothetical protein